MNAHDPEPLSTYGTSDPMLDLYLWDGTGDHDESIAALEATLSGLRWQQQPLPLESVRQPKVTWAPVAPLRAAAALALLVTGMWLIALLLARRDHDATNADGISMTVRALRGSPRIAGQTLTESGDFAVGQWLETDGQSSAQVLVADYGTVKVEPDSRLRLVHARAGEQRLELAHGSLSALISAPPRLFVVDTPAAAAVDLGCAYRLNVDGNGDGNIEVTLGWVSMENHGIESIVPRGAKCLTRKSKGVGTPFYADASAALVKALERFDFEDGGDDALSTILQEAAVRDSLTLWHLLVRTSGTARQRIYDRLAQLNPPPAESTRDEVLQGDRDALNAWRNALGWSPSLPRLKVK